MVAWPGKVVQAAAANSNNSKMGVVFLVHQFGESVWFIIMVLAGRPLRLLLKGSLQTARLFGFFMSGKFLLNTGGANEQQWIEIGPGLERESDRRLDFSQAGQDADQFL